MCGEYGPCGLGSEGSPQWFRIPPAPSASGPTGPRFDARGACESMCRIGAHSDGLAAMPAPMIDTHMAADAPDRRSYGRVGRPVEGGVVGWWATARSPPNRHAVYCRRLGERAIDVAASCHDMPPHGDPANHDHPGGGPGKQAFMWYFHTIASAMRTQ
jgi:hypothetical protein